MIAAREHSARAGLQPQLTPASVAWLIMFALLAFAVLGTAVFGAVAHAQEPETVIDGRVVNASSGGGSVDGLTVTLHRVEQVSRQEFKTTTDSEGLFDFKGLTNESDVVYGVSVSYQGAFYGMDLDVSEWPPAPFELTVYDSESDDNTLSVTAASVLFLGANPNSGMISAMEIVSLVNSGDRTYVPGPEPMDLLRFGLPLGALGLKLETSLIGADHIQVDRGFALLGNVPPGRHEVMYTYQFPYTGSTAFFERSFRYGADHLRVLTPAEAMGLTSDSLGNAQVVTVGETRYRLLETMDLSRGTPVSVELLDLPISGTGSSRWDEVRFEYAAPVSLGLLMALLLGYALWRHIGKREGAPKTEPSSPRHSQDGS